VYTLKGVYGLVIRFNYFDNLFKYVYQELNLSSKRCLWVELPWI